MGFKFLVLDVLKSRLWFHGDASILLCLLMYPRLYILLIIWLWFYTWHDLDLVRILVHSVTKSLFLQIFSIRRKDDTSLVDILIPYVHESSDLFQIMHR